MPSDGKGGGMMGGGMGGSNRPDLVSVDDFVASILRQIGFIAANDLLAIKELISKMGVGVQGLARIDTNAINSQIRRLVDERRVHNLATLEPAVRTAFLQQIERAGTRTLSVRETERLKRWGAVANGEGPTRGGTAKSVRAQEPATATEHYTKS